MVQVLVAGAQVDRRQGQRLLHQRGQLVAGDEGELAIHLRREVALQQRELAQLLFKTQGGRGHGPHGGQRLELPHRGKPGLHGGGVHVVQVVLVLLQPGFEQGARALRQAGGQGVVAHAVACDRLWRFRWMSSSEMAAGVTP